jgi:molecular chaperone GrpE
MSRVRRKTVIEDTKKSTHDIHSQENDSAEEAVMDATANGSSEVTLEVSEQNDANDTEVTDPLEQVEILEKKLKATHDRMLRTAADLDNLRKRSRREIAEAIPRGRQEVLGEILPVIDSIDLALASANPEGPAEAIIEGLKMIKKQFLNVTERFGLQEIESVNLAFDPNFHEAVAQVASDEFPAGQVVEEMRRGYMIEDRLLRPSMVIVSKGALESGETSADASSSSDNAGGSLENGGTNGTQLEDTDE